MVIFQWSSICGQVSSMDQTAAAVCQIFSPWHPCHFHFLPVMVPYGSIFRWQNLSTSSCIPTFCVLFLFIFLVGKNRTIWWLNQTNSQLALKSTTRSQGVFFLTPHFLEDLPVFVSNSVVDRYFARLSWLASVNQPWLDGKPSILNMIKLCRSDWK
jgi:hypothetical protein